MRINRTDDQRANIKIQITSFHTFIWVFSFTVTEIIIQWLKCMYESTDESDEMIEKNCFLRSKQTECFT